MSSQLKKESKYFHKNQEGAALFLAVMLLGLVFVIGTTITKIQLRELRFGIKEDASTKALFAADAGIERSLYYIYQETGLLPDTCTSTGCYIPLTTLENGADYHVIVPRGNDDPVLIGSDTEYIILRAIGSFQQTERSLEVNLYKKIPPS